MSDLLVEPIGSVTWLRLNRPDRRNAYDEAMLEALIAAVHEAPCDQILVVTGSEGAFCAGGYLRNLAEPNERDLRRMFYGSLRLFDALRAGGTGRVAR